MRARAWERPFPALPGPGRDLIRQGHLRRAVTMELEALRPLGQGCNVGSRETGVAGCLRKASPAPKSIEPAIDSERINFIGSSPSREAGY
jgi:hypothetical protein